MKVVEIFDSIQGEGYYMGIPCTFVRFAGCNLHCDFCDERSKYGNAKEMTVPEILSLCHKERVVLTGGEPTLQQNLGTLIQELNDAGHWVSIETNGTHLVPNSELCWITCSPKADNEYKVVFQDWDEMKIVCDENIMNHPGILQDIQCELTNDNRGGEVIWLQPCDGALLEESKKFISDYILHVDSIHFRAGIQLHKYYEVV